MSSDLHQFLSDQTYHDRHGNRTSENVWHQRNQHMVQKPSVPASSKWTKLCLPMWKARQRARCLRWRLIFSIGVAAKAWQGTQSVLKSPRGNAFLNDCNKHLIIMVIRHWQIQHAHTQMANSSSQRNMFESPLWLESAHGWPGGLEEVSMKAWRPTGFCVLVSLIYLTRFSTALWYRVWCCFRKIHVLVLVPLILDPTRVATYNPDMTSVPSKWLRTMQVSQITTR